MNEKNLAKQLKYSSPMEIYIVTWENRLVILKCPFEVLVLKNIQSLKRGQIVVVEEVKVTEKLVTVFVIFRVPYYYFHFDFVL